jgi:hypothetical protein
MDVTEIIGSDIFFFSVVNDLLTIRKGRVFKVEADENNIFYFVFPYSTIKFDGEERLDMETIFQIENYYCYESKEHAVNNFNELNSELEMRLKS